jgi:hypothetical protein
MNLFDASVYTNGYLPVGGTDVHAIVQFTQITDPTGPGEQNQHDPRWLRVWTPLAAELLFERQVDPDLLDLTAARREVTALTGEYPLGEWTAPSRYLHVAVRLSPRPVGARQLGARLQLVDGSKVVTEALVTVTWSNDPSLTSRPVPEVARYSGRVAVAEAVRDGLGAIAAGDVEAAAGHLGSATRLAADIDDEEMTTRLRRLVDVDEHGRARLRHDPHRLEEMALDLQTMRTARVQPRRGDAR